MDLTHKTFSQSNDLSSISSTFLIKALPRPTADEHQSRNRLKSFKNYFLRKKAKKESKLITMADEDGEGEDQQYYDNYGSSGSHRKGNNLPFWGNQATMNLNPLILANITNSPYFKVNLAEVKVRATFCEIRLILNYTVSV